ncbi:anti-sigma-I factor RsgI2-like [Macrobrachium rosenbergii]|uniref:anti-sigma-I factor RsgI2-like n=1 Tax=Macrobrachium rosenbergii TaxID=79674 RepID=UPI0034D4C142
MGPILVAPPQGSYPAHQVEAFEDTGAQISMIWEDKVPYGDKIEKHKLVTIESINQVKLILSTVCLRVTRPHQTKICTLAVADYLPGGYDLLLGQDSLSQPNSKQPKGSDPSQSPSGTNSPLLPGPHECPEQCHAPSASVVEPLPNLIPVQGPALVPVPEHTIDLPSGNPKLDSNSLPVPLECPEQCHTPSIPNVEPTSNLSPEPGPALMTVPEPIPTLTAVPGLTLVPVPEHTIDLPSGDPSPYHLSSPVLTLLSVPVREPTQSLLGSLPGSPDLNRSTTPGTALQPEPELIIVTC